MIVTLDELKKNLSNHRLKGKRILLCNGTFDLIHIGHIRHINEAKLIGNPEDILVVAVASDKQVRKRKGNGRPIFPETERMEIIDSIKHVNYTILNDYKNGVELINEIKPDFYIKGDNYIRKGTPGISAERKAIESVGGIMGYTGVYGSTTDVIHRIKNYI